MPDFDPFSGGPNFSPVYSAKKKPKQKETKKIITLLIFVAIGFLIYWYFFLNVASISFSVNDTEGRAVNNAALRFSKEPSLSKPIDLEIGEEIKLRKGTYYYRISATDYIQTDIKEIKLSEDNTITEELEKNISLIINSFTCPENVYAGQSITCQINLENKNSFENYDLNYLVFGGDASSWSNFKDKTYTYVDYLGDPIPESQKQLAPQRSGVFYIRFTVPVDEKVNSTQKLSVRVKYRSKDTRTANALASLKIVEEPNISISGLSVSEQLTSGDTKNINYKIDNKKNNVDISQISVSYEINAIKNTDANTWFYFDPLYFTIPKKTSANGLIRITVPTTAKTEEITGRIILNSDSFREPKIFNINLNIKEPENKFSVTLSKTSVSLNYDSNSNESSQELLNIKLDNKNKVPVYVEELVLENSTGTIDCNNWVELPPNFNDTSIIGNNFVEAPAIIKGKEIIDDPSGTIKVCTIKVRYKNPFGTQEILEDLKTITITIRE